MRSVTILPGILFVIALASANANACSCVTPRSPCESFGSASAVFVGTVISGERGAFKFSVEQAYSGVSGTQVEVFTGLGGGDCGFYFEIGRRYLVYAYRHQDKLGTNICTRTKPFEIAREDLAFLGSLSSAASGVTLSGEVRHGDIKGKFVPSDATVIVQGELQRKEVRPDAEGKFSVSGLSPGKFKVSLKLPDKFTASYHQDQELMVTDRGCASVMWFVTDNGRISGRVVTVEGLPVAKIEVSLVDPAKLDETITSARTDEEGKFKFGPLEPGRYLVAVNRTRHSDHKDPTNAYTPTFYPGVTDQTHARVITLEAGENASDLEIRVAAKRTTSVINGNVVWDDGAPVKNAMVLVKDAAYGEFWVLKADGQGRFKIDGYVSQKLVVEARHEPPNAESSEPVEISEEITITLERSAETLRIVINRNVRP